ncbi:MAG: LPS export ABC transporter permease LptG [Legionella sp.]|nr:LPS export ABC transporter permease LptG [Legionella sp.]
MTLLKKQIVKTILSALGFVTLILAGLQLFILFVGQLGDVGKGQFGLWQTTLYVLLQLPYQVYLFFPLACLLGTLVGLSIMANHRELIVMRAVGMSMVQITWIVIQTALGLILLVTVMGETVIPNLTHWAITKKAQAINGGKFLRTAQGIWLRHEQNFILVGLVLSHEMLADVYQFHFKQDGKMDFSRKIDRVLYQNKQWEAYGISETRFQADKTITSHTAHAQWDTWLRPAVFSMSRREPDEMSLLELRRYLGTQIQSYRNVSNYQLAFWQRLAQPLTTLVMMLLAIPFIFGPLRSSSMGSKLVVGATVGFGFYMLHHFFGPVSQVLQWSPLFAAFGPTCIFAILGMVLMQRAR